jgi:hypothetical protein
MGRGERMSMSLSDVGVPGQQIDVLNGGDIDPSGRLLSVAEIQQAFRDLRQRRHRQAQASAPGPSRVTTEKGPHTGAAPEDAGPDTLVGPSAEPPHISPAQPPAAPHSSPKPAKAAEGGGRLGRDWTAVVAAHSGAGASCVALAIADALSAADRPCRLIEAAHPTRSGLVAAAAAELGMDPTGAWRRGSRHLTTLYRRAGDLTPNGWPEPAGADPATTVVDLGLPAPANLSRLVNDQPHIVVVCRATVPGVRLAEHLLSELDTAPVVLAAVGAGRWPGEVTASLGPRVRGLRDAKQIVTIPDDRHLQVTGPTNSPLPKSVAAAGRSLLGLVDAAHPGGVTTWAQRAPRRRGTTR